MPFLPAQLFIEQLQAKAHQALPDDAQSQNRNHIVEQVDQRCVVGIGDIAGLEEDERKSGKESLVEAEARLIVRVDVELPEDKRADQDQPDEKDERDAELPEQHISVAQLRTDQTALVRFEHGEKIT